MRQPEYAQTPLSSAAHDGTGVSPLIEMFDDGVKSNFSGKKNFNYRK